MILAAIISKLKQNDPSLNIQDEDSLRSILLTTLSSDSLKYTKQYLKEIGVNKEKILQALELVKADKPKKIETNKIINIINQFEKTFPKSISKVTKYDNKDSTKKHKVFETNIKPEQLTTTIDGSGNFVYSDNYVDMKLGRTTTDYSVDSIQNYLEKTEEYEKEINNHKYLKIAYNYTGATYKSINNGLRNTFEMFSGIKTGIRGINQHEFDTAKHRTFELSTGKLYDMINDMKPLSQSMWVYRTTDLPEEIQDDLKAGNDFVDPAFLSTTISPFFDHGGANTFRIYIPKGSKVLPILGTSEYPHEKEIVLPALSVLKIIRIDEFEDGLMYITAIYVGSVFEDFKEQFIQLGSNGSIKESLNRNRITDKNKKNTYDPKEKYSSNIDPEQLKAAQKFAKSVKNKK